jgi:hypothetical protein
MSQVPESLQVIDNGSIFSHHHLEVQRHTIYGPYVRHAKQSHLTTIQVLITSTMVQTKLLMHTR